MALHQHTNITIAAALAAAAGVSSYWSFLTLLTNDNVPTQNDHDTPKRATRSQWHLHQHQQHQQYRNNNLHLTDLWTRHWRLVSLVPELQCCECERRSSLGNDDRSRADDMTILPSSPTRPSWWRRALYWCRLYDLPLPRVLMGPNDPALQVPKRLLAQREQDEARLQQLQLEMQKVILSSSSSVSSDGSSSNSNNNNNNNNNSTKAEKQKKLAALALQQYEILYGPGVSPQDRTEFLARYGCTGWTPAVLQRLVELGQGRGFVEMGAGHGQWARALTEEHARQIKENKNHHHHHHHHDNPRDFVLAYDNGSHLPLNPDVYHAQTQPHALYFGKVEKCHSQPSVVLSQWKNRHRILLLVYPTGDLALESLRAYAAMGPENDMVAYVGEGRGGANANDAFFDLLEEQQQQGWILVEIHNVKPFGNSNDQQNKKGFEQLYIFQKNHHHHASSPNKASTSSSSSSL